MKVELASLKKKCLKQDGEPRADAKPDDLKRITFLEAQLEADGASGGQGGDDSNDKTPDPKPAKGKKAAKKATVDQEREIRRYCKPQRKGGGWIKNISDDDKAKAKKLLKEVGRAKPEWDDTIVVPGMDISWKDYRESQK